MFGWLVKAGVVRADGVSRRVTWSRCPGCGDAILRALDGDIVAVAVSLDVGPVDNLGEAIAVGAGLRTFDMVRLLHKKENSYCVEPRRAYHIMRDNRRYPVYVEHRCGLSIPKVPIELKQWSDECPF